MSSILGLVLKISCCSSLYKKNDLILKLSLCRFRIEEMATMTRYLLGGNSPDTETELFSSMDGNASDNDQGSNSVPSRNFCVGIQHLKH